MFKGYVCLSALSFALLSFTPKASGQFQQSYIHGEVKGSSELSPLAVELFDESTHQIVERQPLNWSGNFAFRTQPGRYQVRVATMQGEVLTSTLVNHTDGGIPITIELPQREKARPIHGKISVHELSRQQNKALMKEFAEAEKASLRGDLHASVSHLQKVIQMDPKFAGAYVNLGTRYARLSLPLNARAAFLHAIELDPTLSIAYTNLAITDLVFGDPVGAAAAATAALRLNPGDALALRVIASSKKTNVSAE